MTDDDSEAGLDRLKRLSAATDTGVGVLTQTLLRIPSLTNGSGVLILMMQLQLPLLAGLPAGSH